MMHEINENKNITIIDDKETFNSIYSKTYVPLKYIEKIKKSNVLLLPYENYRDAVSYFFPEFTMEVYRYLNSNDKINAEICIGDDEYKTLELHSEVIIIPIMIINDVVLPIVLSMIAAWLYDKAKSMNKKVEDISTNVNIIVEKNDKSKRIVYKGTVKNFYEVIKTINEELHF